MNRNYNNRLVNQFNNHVNYTGNNSSNNMFSQNAMISNNPNFSMKDAQFYNKIQMAKLEQIKRAQNIDQMGMTKKELYEHIIDPHKIDKTPKVEIEKDLTKIEGMYTIDKINQSNEFLKDLWKKRTNTPYKNVIKKELFDKEYKKYYKDDIFKKDINDKKQLMVHKVIKDVDADEIMLEAEFELLSSILEKHNKELKSIYSVSNKNKFKQDFEYAQKYKYRLEYNPKDAEELKDFYKKEQKKINKENKMLDEIIDMLVEQDELNEDEIKELNKKLEQPNRSSSSGEEHKIILNNNKKSLEDELKEEFGEDLNDIIEALDDSKEDDENNNNDNKIKAKPKITSTPIIKKNKLAIKSTSLNKNTEDSSISEDLKDFYKNRKR